MELKKNIAEEFKKTQTLPDLVDYVTSQFHDMTAIKKIMNEEVISYSFYQLRKDSYRIATYLIQENIVQRNIALIGNLSYEWLIAFLGVTASGNVAVLIDKEIHEDDTVKLLEQSDASAIIIDSAFHEKASGLKEKYNKLEYLLSYGEIQDYSNINCLMGEDISYSHKVSGPDQNAIITFTSGTTGSNKAVLLSHRNVCDNLCCCIHIFDGVLKPAYKTIPLLPQHHMFGLTAGLLLPYYFGLTICFGGGLKYISSDLKMFQPDFLVAVPMIVEGLYKRILSEIKKSGLGKEFIQIVDHSNLLLQSGTDIRKSLFRDIQEFFGGNLRLIVCGGAFLDPILMNQYEEIGIPLRNGYGITECSPVIACNLLHNHMEGSVGSIVPRPYCEVKIVDGEILVRGTIVMKEYYKDKESTEAAFEDGWFKTGDLGYIDNDFLFITGRKKNLIILSDGNNISPEELENMLEKIPLIKEVYACGKSYHNTILVTTCIHPDYEYAEEQKIHDIEREVEREISQINAKLPHYKKIQKIEIYEDAFPKTSLGKIKRYL